MQEGRTYGNSFPNYESEESGRERLEEAEETARVSKMNGGTISMGENGRGLIISISKKQKLNTKSSMEAELIGADDEISQMLWTRYFLKSQGYGTDKNIFYQDNTSAMLLENNGNKSSTKKTKHIHVRYYFIKDRVKTGDVVTYH